VTQAALRLVIFDCDGVLVDSEGLSRVVIAEAAREVGWAIVPDDARRFTGLRWSDVQPAFEREAGVRTAQDWPLAMQARLIERMRSGLEPVAGAAELLRATTALGLAWRVASNSSHEEMAEKFARTGLADLVAGRVHSARDVGVGKPSPALFLAAAAAEGVPPSACIVVEDSLPGIEAAAAAGMRCIAFDPDGEAVGPSVERVRALGELPAIFRSATLDRAA
jgi:HAD superfamily hydrolase (TIGR01509 family)